MNTISPKSPSYLRELQQVQHPRHSLGSGQMLKQIAGKLSIDPAKLQDAFEHARDIRAKGEDFLSAVANELGIQTDTLQQAIQQTNQSAHAAQGVRPHHSRSEVQGLNVSSILMGQSLNTKGTDITIDVSA